MVLYKEHLNNRRSEKKIKVLSIDGCSNTTLWFTYVYIGNSGLQRVETSEIKFRRSLKGCDIMDRLRNEDIRI